MPTWLDEFEPDGFVPLNRRTPHYLVLPPTLYEFVRQILAEPTRARDPDDWEDWEEAPIYPDFDPAFDTGAMDSEPSIVNDPWGEPQDWDD